MCTTMRILNIEILKQFSQMIMTWIAWKNCVSVSNLWSHLKATLEVID